MGEGEVATSRLGRWSSEAPSRVVSTRLVCRSLGGEAHLPRLVGTTAKTVLHRRGGVIIHDVRARQGPGRHTRSEAVASPR